MKDFTDGLQYEYSKNEPFEFALFLASYVYVLEVSAYIKRADFAGRLLLRNKVKRILRKQSWNIRKSSS
jgi:hypothetical protein